MLGAGATQQLRYTGFSFHLLGEANVERRYFPCCRSAKAALLALPARYVGAGSAVDPFFGATLRYAERAGATDLPAVDRRGGSRFVRVVDAP